MTPRSLQTALNSGPDRDPVDTCVLGGRGGVFSGGRGTLMSSVVMLESAPVPS